jgi:hypothetical protein
MLLFLVSAVFVQTSSAPEIYKSTLFQLKQASSDMAKLCSSFSDKLKLLRGGIAKAKTDYEKQKSAAQARMRNEARISGMPVQSLDPKDYEVDQLNPTIVHKQAEVMKLNRLLRICQSSLPILHDGLSATEAEIPSHAKPRSDSTTKSRIVHNEAPLATAERKLSIAQSRMKQANLPLKASIMLRTANRVLSVFDSSQMPQSHGHFVHISAVRATLESAVVMATELSQISRKLVLRVWLLQDKVKKARQTVSSKVLSVAMKGTKFNTLHMEDIVEQSFLKTVLESCKNMTGMYYLRV